MASPTMNEPDLDHRAPDRVLTIFRPEAIERHRKGCRRAVQPRFDTPRAVPALWLVLGLLGIVGAAVWLVSVPVYVSGAAVVTAGSVATSDAGEEVVALVFLPAAERHRLRVGGMVTLHLGVEGEPVRRAILAVEPEIIDPAAARQRFALPLGAAQTLTSPSVVVVVGLEPLPPDRPAVTLLGRVGRADVEVGARRAGSFLPVVGRHFAKGA
jgi:hypothetical protein